MRLEGETHEENRRRRTASVLSQWFLGQRIAQKIFLSYGLPLAISIVAGFVLPFVLWSYLGGPGADYAERIRLANKAVNLLQATQEVEKQSRSYVLYRDDAFQQQYHEARENYRVLFRETFDLIEQTEDSSLQASLQTASTRYRTWLRTTINPEVRTAQLGQLRGTSSPASRQGAARVSAAYQDVKTGFEALTQETGAYRDRQRDIARATDIIRRITAVVLPVVAVLLALLIGRSVALGITRPLEELRRATEQLERGNMAPLLLTGARDSNSPAGVITADSDDEIGDLQAAFRRMARTIGQREAVLKAQNEALGELNRRIEALLNATNDGILMLDRGGGFSLVNQRLAYFFGLSADDLLDHTFEQAGAMLLSRFRKKSEVRVRLRELLDDPEAIFEDTYDIGEPVARTLRIYSAPVRGEAPEHSASDTGTDTPAIRSDILGRIFVFRDVTRETTVDRMKTEFVSTVSHELRTPLTAIKGYVDLMVSGQTGPLNEIQTEFMTLVQQSTKRLTALINDMLDISRIESGRVEIRKEFVDYLPLIHQTVRMMDREAEMRKLTLNVEVLPGAGPPFPLVSGDADRITQVLINLISNSIKYTPSGGKVTIRVEYEDEFVTTCVADTGIGVSAEDQKKLFQKFFRADNSTTREVGGTGLGLAITKAILEKLNGSIWVESEPGKGTQFFFTLPTSHEATSPENQTEALPLLSNGMETGANSSGSSTASRLILSVDGDVAVLHRIGYELRRVGFVTANATTPADALRRAKDLRPDLITLDPLTPGMDGLALLKSFRTEPSTRAYPVVLLSLNLHGGRAEVRDGYALVQRQEAASQLPALVAKAFQQRGGVVEQRRLALVVSEEEDLAQMVRQSLAGAEQVGADVHLLYASGTDQADALIGDQFPVLLVLDTNAAPGKYLGEWVSRLKRRRPASRLPIILITDDEVLTEGVSQLMPFGAQPTPFSSLPNLLEDRLARLEAKDVMDEPEGVSAAVAAREREMAPPRPLPTGSTKTPA